MGRPTLGLLLPETGETDRVAFAQEAEQNGFDQVWDGQLWGENVVVRLTQVARQTDKVELGTSILNVFSRSPAELAMTGKSLTRVSDGRAIVGLGVGTRKGIEDLHGLSFDRPVRRLHETVELVKSYTSGQDEPVTYDGELFSVEDFSALEADFPVYNAALGPANLRATGRVCDGWIPHNIPFPNLEDSFRTIRETARESGRNPDDITVSPYVPAAVSADPERAHDTVEKHIAYYVGSADGYRHAVSEHFPAEAAAVHERWNAGDREAAREAIPTEMRRALGISGTPEAARERLLEILEETPIDVPVIAIPRPAEDSVVRDTFEALSPTAF